jgi:hypothetical protein
MDTPLDKRLQLEAVRFNSLITTPVSQIFSYVISMPVLCPGCRVPWAVLVNEPHTLEIELGLIGKRHIELLTEAMMESCKSKDGGHHFRTDGMRVWQPTY